MNATPILYSFRRCPYAMRARMALLISGSDFVIREVVLRDKPAALVAASAKATVPVFCLPEGAVIDESIDIMRWTLRQNDPENWLAGDDAALIQRFDTQFKDHLDRYKYAERYKADPIAHRDAGLVLLHDLEARLSAHPNLCGPDRTLGDVAIMPFVRQFAAVDRAWFDDQPLPRTQNWLARHLASPLFERAMVRLAPWAPDDAPIIWPGTDA